MQMRRFINVIVEGLQEDAWHGSPHKFDKFSTDHINSGEGAQRQGWGIYFADRRDVADFYSNAHGRPGHIYQVQIPDEGSYLLWDEPLSVQSEIVKAGVKKAWMSEWPWLKDGPNERLTGEQIYNTLNSSSPKKEVSLRLRDAGIVGNKYRDGSGGDTYNYVIFDDSAISMKSAE
jgi:ADP-Ribosyltransferase in polyvalent proteins